MDLHCLRLGIQIGFVGRKQHVTTFGFELGAIGLKGTRVAVEIFVRQELQTIDKNAGHRAVAVLAGQPNELEVPRVQIAHGGNEGGACRGGQSLPQGLRRSADDHLEKA